MQRSTLLTLIIVTATSLSAVPAADAQREEHGGRVPYGQRYHRPPPPPPPQTDDWIRLATPTPTRFGTEYFVLDPDAIPLRALRIDAQSGAVQLRQVRVETVSGRILTYNVNVRLDRRHPSARIDFGRAHRIARLVVTTARRPSGTYVIFGTWRIPRDVLIAAR